MNNDTTITNIGGSSSSSTCESSKPIKRMIWFLVEADQGLLLGGQATDTEIIRVFHITDLVEEIITDENLPRSVNFRGKDFQVECKLLLASDDLSVVIDAMQQNAEKHMLVQYYDQNKSQLVHEVVPHKFVNNRNAIVMTCHEKRDYIEKVMIDLNGKCFDEANEADLEKNPNMDDNTWLLIQYSPNWSTMIYTVIKYSQTVMREQNVYKDVAAYILQPDQSVLQAVVMCYSQDRAKMEAKLKHLAQFFLSVQLPKPETIDDDMGATSRIFQRSAHCNTAKERELTIEYHRAQAESNEFTEKLRDEAITVLDAFEMINTLDKELQSRKDYLEETLVTL